MGQPATIFLGGPMLVATTKRKRGRPRKVTYNMTPNETPNGTATEQPTATPAEPKANPVTRTVFDLAEFDDVKLSKPFTPPAKPTTLEEALAAVGNDRAKLLDVIYEGLTAEARNSAYDNIEGFYKLDENGAVTTELYTGKYADEEKSKLINNGILSLAKMQAGGNWSGLTAEQKKAAKAKAVSFLRDNPAMLASLQS